MEIIEPNTAPEQKPDTPAPTSLQDQAADIEMMKLERYFGLANPSSEEAKFLNELRHIYQNPDIVEMLWEIKQTENRIGTPPLGMSRLQHLYNFSKINHQIKQLERERDLYGG